MHTTGEVDLVRLRKPSGGYTFAFLAVTWMICLLHDPEFIVFIVTIVDQLAIS